MLNNGVLSFLDRYCSDYIMLRLVFILYLPGIFIVIVMETLENKHDMFYPHVSVDCVLLGTNDDKLCEIGRASCRERV